MRGYCNRIVILNRMFITAMQVAGKTVTYACTILTHLILSLNSNIRVTITWGRVTKLYILRTLDVNPSSFFI